MAATNRRLDRNRQDGFSLIELVMVMIVLGVLGAVALYPMMTNTIQAYNYASRQEITSGQLRVGLERIARELREVEETGGSFSFTIGTVNRVGFTKTDGVTVIIDGSVLPNVSIQYSTPALTRNLVTLATAFTFAYFQADGVTAATNVTNVRIISIQMAVQDPVSGFSQSQSTRVVLRN